MSTALALHIEDSDSDAALIKGWLDELDVEVVLAKRVARGEEILRGHMYSFDAILLDLAMPDATDGFETFKRVKAARNGKDIPIIVLTKMSLPQTTIDRMRRDGAFQVLTKQGGKEHLRVALMAAQRSKPPRKDSPPPAPSTLATKDWVQLQLAQLELRLNPILDWVEERKADHERAQTESIRPKSRRSPMEAMKQDWPGALKEVARAAIVIAGTYGAVRATMPTQPEHAQSAQVQTR